MYRPEGWENPHKPDGYDTNEYLDHGARDRGIYEAGADAMLEGLIKNHSRKVEQGYDTNSEPLGFVADGIYIELFISEEK